MTDVPVLGMLTPWRIRSEMGVKAERSLQSLVAKVVAAIANQSFGRSVLEGVYLAGFEHGATMMERKLTKTQSDNRPKQATPESRTDAGEKP